MKKVKQDQIAKTLEIKIYDILPLHIPLIIFSLIFLFIIYASIDYSEKENFSTYVFVTFVSILGILQIISFLYKPARIERFYKHKYKIASKPISLFFQIWATALFVFWSYRLFLAFNLNFRYFLLKHYHFKPWDSQTHILIGYSFIFFCIGTLLYLLFSLEYILEINKDRKLIKRNVAIGIFILLLYIMLAYPLKYYMKYPYYLLTYHHNKLLGIFLLQIGFFIVYKV